MGVQIQPVSKDFAESLGLENEKGAFVSNVNPKGPSKKAGIEDGDVILKFNDIEIVKMTDLPRVVASVSIMGSIGALPPGSGPNDLSENLNELIGYKPDNKLLGPISKMPDNNSSVFLSLVAFAFIGGLVEVGRKNKLDLS